MAQTINTLAMSSKVQNYLTSAQEQTSEASERLGSGLRINSARDDAAGLAIAERLESLVRDLNVSVRNAYEGVSLSAVAEGGLEQVSDQLQQMRELALQSANGSYSDSDRANLNAQFSALNDEISRIASTTTFNNIEVLGSGGESVDFQVGASDSNAGTLSVELAGINSLSADIGTVQSANVAINRIDAMIADVSNTRASFSAAQSQFQSTISNLQTSSINQSAAQSRIEDADYALEAALFTRSRILEQSGIAMSVQANVSAQSVTQLLG